MTTLLLETRIRINVEGTVRHNLQKSGPGPPSTPSLDIWVSYTVAGMDIISVRTGTGKVEKLIILLHGGGREGTERKQNYDMGWFGDTSGLKYVFPSPPNKI